MARCPWWATAGFLVALGCGGAGPRVDAGSRDAVDAAVDVASDTRADLNDAAADLGDDGVGPGDAGDAQSPDARDARDTGMPLADATGDAVTSVPCRPGSRWFELDYPVATAAYSRALDVMVLVPDNEHALHILDPESCSDRTVALPRRILSLSLAPSGREAAIGHDGAISIIDLASATVKATYPIPHPGSEVAFDWKGRVQVFTSAPLFALAPLLAVDVATGSVATRAANIDAVGHVHITPDGQGLFWTVAYSTEDTFYRVDLDTGVSQAPLNRLGDLHVCHRLFPTDDSAHLITGCGTVLDISNADPTQDPRPQGALEGVTSLDHLDALTSKGVVVSTSGEDVVRSPTGTNVGAFIRVHDSTTYRHLKSINLPTLATDEGPMTPVGRFVFIRSDAQHYYVLARRRGGTVYGGLADGVARLDASDSTDGGAPAQSPIPVPIPPTYDVPPPVINVPTSTVPLAFDVQDAAYSRTLDRLIVASASPTPAVLLVDPQTGAAESIAMPSSPSKVFVRADGILAAVVRQGGVTFLDLRTRTIVREQMIAPPTATATTPIAHVDFGPDPQALVPDGAGLNLSWLDLGTGTSRPAFHTFGTFGFAAVPDTLRFYTAGAVFPSSKALARHDDIAVAADSPVDLDIFAPLDNVTPACGSHLWISDDGARLVLDCGRVYRLSTTRDQDLTYAGSLERTVNVRDVAYARATGRMFVVPGLVVEGSTFYSALSAITVYDDDFLNLRAIALSAAPVPGVTIMPKRVFIGPTTNRVYVLTNNYTAPLVYSVVTLDVTGL